MRVVWISAVATAIGLGLMAALAGGCYPRPPVDPPTCAQDPTQEWCLPPSFVPAPDGAAAGCRRVVWRPGTVAMACDDHEPVPGGVDLVVERGGRTWDACAWNSCGRDPNCRDRLFKHDGGAR